MNGHIVDKFEGTLLFFCILDTLVVFKLVGEI